MKHTIDMHNYSPGPRMWCHDWEFSQNGLHRMTCSVLLVSFSVTNGVTMSPLIKHAKTTMTGLGSEDIGVNVPMLWNVLREHFNFR